jgi:lipid II:glycine glycyltransferase (peptidoglycan interpeptide bridge formation enzyme)
MDFAFRNAGYHFLRREVSSILFLEQSVEENLANFKSTHKTAVRKAEKSGIIIRQTEDFEEFYAILKKNLSIRHNVFPTHSLSELVILKELYPDKINLFGAYLENEMIAGVINFIVNERVVLAFYISHDESYQELRPINLLFYKIFDWAIQNEFKVFDFGIFTVNEKPNMGLARFKENFGASGVFRDVVELRLR